LQLAHNGISPLNGEQLVHLDPEALATGVGQDNSLRKSAVFAMYPASTAGLNGRR
jgi:hypothetical protein